MTMENKNVQEAIAAREKIAHLSQDNDVEQALSILDDVDLQLTHLSATGCIYCGGTGVADFHHLVNCEKCGGDGESRDDEGTREHRRYLRSELESLEMAMFTIDAVSGENLAAYIKKRLAEIDR